MRAAIGGSQTAPNPTDQRKKGSKHRVITGTHGIPLVCTLTGANWHDIAQLIPLLHSILLWSKGIEPRIAQRGEPHGSNRSKVRGGVECTIRWLPPFRRLRVPFER